MKKLEIGEIEKMNYQTLESYKAGNIAVLWTSETNTLIASDTKLSPMKAGCIAAAKIASHAGNEYEALENALRGNITNEEAELYDWLVDNYEIKRELIDLSGTRSLIADMEV